jgi:type I site-specific restriction endonuclease
MTHSSIQQAAKPLDSRPEEVKSYALISELIDHFITTERGSLEKLKVYIADLISKEVRRSIQDNISTIISEHNTIRNLEQQLNDKDNHIEQLELMVFELQSLVRLRSVELSKGTIDDDMQFNSTNSSISKVKETVADMEKYKKKNLAAKLRSLFSITSHCRGEPQKTASDSES